METLLNPGKDIFLLLNLISLQLGPSKLDVLAASFDPQVAFTVKNSSLTIPKLAKNIDYGLLSHRYSLGCKKCKPTSQDFDPPYSINQVFCWCF